MNRFSSLLRLACKLIEIIERDRKNIKTITKIGKDRLVPAKEKLLSIDVPLFNCVDKLPDNEKQSIMDEVSNLPSNFGLLNQTNTGSEPDTFGYRKPDSGINYTIKVLEDLNSPGIAKRRYAAVFTEGGVEVMRGPMSFSSSTRILVDEIKFRINNQLP